MLPDCGGGGGHGGGGGPGAGGQRGRGVSRHWAGARYTGVRGTLYIIEDQLVRLEIERRYLYLTLS